MSKSTHYVEEGDILCSHGKEGSERSNSILDVTCGHCWRKYDEKEDRLPNVRELEKYSALIRGDLKEAIAIYNSDEPVSLSNSEREVERVTKFAFWFLEGPDSLPERVREGRDLPVSDASLGRDRTRFMTVDNVPKGAGYATKRYREHVDALLHAMRPVLVDREEAQESSVSAELERKVLDRAADMCPMCGENFSESRTSSIDHIIPTILGGPTEEWNLRVLCNRCNAFKHVMVDPDGIDTVVERFEKRIRE